MMKRKVEIILISFLTVFILSCSRSTHEQSVSEKEEPIPIEGPLLAKVGDWEIGLDDFNRLIKGFEDIKELKELTTVEGKKKLLRDLVDTTLLAYEARQEGLDKEPEVRRRIIDATNQVLAQALISKLMEDVYVSGEEIRKYYEKNKEYLRKPEKRKVREIVVSSEEKAKEVMKRLLDGEDFTYLARTYSIAESRNKGGDLGYIEPNLKKKFRKFIQEAFTKRKGEISNYFKGPDNRYYIIKVEDIKKGEILPFEEIRDAVRNTLRMEKISDTQRRLLTDIRSKVDVVINDELLEKD